MFVIGTAGHVDHGKSLLVEALTGIDPDRLSEEKARGMTIDLGFAWLTLPSGRQASIVDVPGHDRFIKNMLAGVGGIDLALLVVAADEGVMPQTREHVAILDLLGIAGGVLAITKKDLATDEMLALVTADAVDAIRGTTLEGARPVACSAVTREGLDTVRNALDEQLNTAQPKQDIGRPRLPVDRSFTIAGFGTVVTGTLIDGPFAVGQDVEIMPGGDRARIRGLQNHREQVEHALPGRRTAVNLSGIRKDDVRRGQVLVRPDTLAPTDAIDARVRAINASPHALRHGTMLTFHAGSAEVEARLLLLDCDEILPGQRAWTQLRLLAQVAVVRGDRFVLRTPNDTVAGGEIVDAHPLRHRRFHDATIAMLEALSSGSSSEVLRTTLRRIGPATLADIARHLDVPEEQARALSESADESVIVLPGGVLTTRELFLEFSSRVREMLAAYHKEHPVRAGMPSAELSTRLNLPGPVVAASLSYLVDGGMLRTEGDVVALAEFAPSLSTGQQKEVEAFLASLAESPYAPPTDYELGPGLLDYLSDQRAVVDVGDGIVFERRAYEQMMQQVLEHLQREGSITLAQVRDMFRTSRKYAQALLEDLDRKHVTRRVGDTRIPGVPGEPRQVGTR
jgi:selenocysteine-specific elongation factor